MSKKIATIGAACGLGNAGLGTHLGPEFFLNPAHAPAYLDVRRIIGENADHIDCEKELVRLCTALADETYQLVKQQEEPFLVLGGDHAIALGTWSGVAAALPEDETLGLIWFDAHCDAHTHQTTPSGNIHGMPVAALLGHGEENLTHIQTKKPKIKPENLILIGIRSYEPEEEALLKKLGVTIHYVEEVLNKGIDAILHQSIVRLQQTTGRYGISIDIDGIDPVDAPAVNTPVENGIRLTDFTQAITRLHNDPRLIGVEVVEYNPTIDQEGKTKACLHSILEAIFQPQETG